MEITSSIIYYSIINGAKKVINNQQYLNDINVFPVKDHDTGSNLSSMMKSIIYQAQEYKNINATLNSIAEAALIGARGNSGIIFAQYFAGFAQALQKSSRVDYESVAMAFQQATNQATLAIDHPVKGTIITTMEVWSEALQISLKESSSFKDRILNCFKKLEIALENTVNQSKVLNMEHVVDSGAKGFTLFIEGLIDYLFYDQIIDEQKIIDQSIIFKEKKDLKNNLEPIKNRYCTEALLVAQGLNIQQLKKYLINFGDSLVIGSTNDYYRIHIHCNNPKIVFDYLSKKGELIFQKVDDMLLQANITCHRKADIALVTDSVADLPKQYLNDQQINIINLPLLADNLVYFDKLTVNNQEIFKLNKANNSVSSSLPNPKNFQKLIEFLLENYHDIFIITVASELSGTYNCLKNVIKDYQDQANICLIDSCANCNAEGLLVKYCAELISLGYDFVTIEKMVKDKIKKTKILVQINGLESMVNSGRLNIHLAKFAQKVNLRPLVSLNEQGKGCLYNISFSNLHNDQVIMKVLKKLKKANRLKEYSIVHVNNEQAAKHLAIKLTNSLQQAPTYIMPTSSIIALKAGDKCVAVAYMEN